MIRVSKDVGYDTPVNKGNTLKCLSIGTPKIINFPFVSNGKLIFLESPNIQAHCNEAVLCLNFGTPENNEFSIWNKWKIYYFKVSQYLGTLGYKIITKPRKNVNTGVVLILTQSLQSIWSGKFHFFTNPVL